MVSDAMLNMMRETYAIDPQMLTDGNPYRGEIPINGTGSVVPFSYWKSGDQIVISLSSDLRIYVSISVMGHGYQELDEATAMSYFFENGKLHLEILLS